MRPILSIALATAAFAWATHACSQTSSPEIANTVSLVLSQSAWTEEAQACPTQVFPRLETLDFLVKNECVSGQFSRCFSKCAAGEAAACYWLGQELQSANANPVAFEALYQRACKLGVVSGCTNRAAGMLKERPDDKNTETCAANTFDQGCKYDDPWACTMSALHLALGKGVAKNRENALKALQKSCKYGPEDEACMAGNRMKEALLGELKAKTQSAVPQGSSSR